MLGGATVFLTGPPGAGKTYVLNEFIQRAEQQGKRVAVTASTGIAATHIGGTTIHSWSGLGIRESLNAYDREWLRSNDRLIKRYNAAGILVIDEISMLHGQRLDMVNEACKLLRESEMPFGGLQVILVGDLFQLPPVNRGSELVDFAHTSAAWQELNPKVCYLSEQHRQQNDGLLDLLNAMRSGTVNEHHESLITDRLGKRPDEGAVTRLYAHNIDVESINQKHLAALPSETKLYSMQTKGTASKVEQLIKSVLAPEQLELKKGAEVMFVANNFSAGFVNGSRGRIYDFSNSTPVVELIGSGRVVKVEPHSWTLSEDGKKRAEVVQLPLRLAWAITIHKSQGMSLDAAEIDLSRSFTPGMGYVALSRVRSIEGVFLRGINQMALAMQPTIYEFDVELREASELLASSVPDVDEEDTVSAIADEEVEIVTDQVLFDKLRHWRLERSRIEKVAPFMIAHDAALQEIARSKPISPQQLLSLKGFGPKKLDAYGSEILAIISEHTGAALHDSGVWTTDEDDVLHKSLAAGTSLEETAQRLDRTPSEVWARVATIVGQITV